MKLKKVFEDRANIYLVLEYVKGLSLYKYIKEKKSGLGEGQTRLIFRQILDALVYLHQRNIAHRDIKLDNIIITGVEEGDDNSQPKRVKVIDLGFAITYAKYEKSNTF